MTDVLEVLKIISQGQATNAPAEITLKVIKQYCENELKKMEEQLCENQ